MSAAGADLLLRIIGGLETHEHATLAEVVMAGCGDGLEGNVLANDAAEQLLYILQQLFFVGRLLALDLIPEILVLLILVNGL